MTIPTEPTADPVEVAADDVWTPGGVLTVAPTLQLPRLVWAAVIVWTVLGVAIAASSVTTAHNVRELCEVNAPVWPGQGPPCW